jgi:aromatic ring-opening dioxygenase catalytic subunit (LigB family)
MNARLPLPTLLSQTLVGFIIEDCSRPATRLADWRHGLFATYAHPREEHLIPLMVAAGGGGQPPGERIFADEPMGAAISPYRFHD